MQYDEGRIRGNSGYSPKTGNRSLDYPYIHVRQSGVYDFEKDRYVIPDKRLERDIFEKKENKTTRRPENYKTKREERRKKRKRQALMRRIAAGAAAIGIGIGTSSLILKAAPKQNTDSNINTAPYITEAPQDYEATESFIAANSDEIAQNIINSNSEVREVYYNITESLDRFSSQLGTDGLSLIKNRVNTIGEGEIEVIDVLKILYIESSGRIYDNNGEYLVSYTGEAYGPFQLTPDTIDYLNYYYGFTGTENELDIMNPYDNLDACIYNLKFLKEKKENDLKENGILPTGNDIMEAVFWGYHDGAWASSITDKGEYYLEQYRNLSIIDEYPEVISYITEDSY